MENVVQYKKNLQESQLSVSVLERSIEFYKKQNEQLEDVLKKLKTVHEKTSTIPLPALSHSALEKLVALQEKLECLETNPTPMALSHAEMLRKHKNYASKLQLCIKAYTMLNDKIVNETKTFKRKLLMNSESNRNLLSTTDDELKVLETKIKRYENELLKFEVKYPWLKDPMLDLPKIEEKMLKLEKLREEKSLLLNKLEVYNGLKPDVQEATKQLKEIKRKYEHQQELLLHTN